MSGLSDRERAIRQRLKDDFPHYAAKCLKIRTKTGSVEPLIFNKAQTYIHQRLEEQKARTGKVRALILKGRQQGVSTYVGGRFYHRASHSRGVRVFILTHEDAATQNLFEMVDRYHEHCPVLVKPSTGAANAKELNFDLLDSGYKVGTAGTKGVGRSSTIQLFHASEAAFWPHAETHAAGILQAIPDVSGSEIIKESTANGVGNVFHQEWREAETGASDFEAIFVPWFWQEEYRSPVPPDFQRDEEEDQIAELYGLDDDQLVWRRRKIAELKDPILFKQEYPLCVAAGQRVGTSRGLLPIEAVRTGDRTSFGAVSATADNGLRDVVSVRTALGYEVVCTPDHRLLSEEGWFPASAVLGKRLVLARPALADRVKAVEWSPFPSVVSRMEITPDIARLLGYFAGDGCWHGGTLSIACEGRDEDVVADVRALLSGFIGVPTERRTGTKKGCIELRVGRRSFIEILNALGLVRAAAPHRIVGVPACIWESPASVVREFLRGLFESDGFCSRDGAKVSLFSKHRAFLHDVQHLLLAFGITCKVTSQDKTNGAGRRYTGNALVMRVSETLLFLSQIGFVSARKQRRLEGYANPQKGRRAAPVRLNDEVVSVTPAGAAYVHDLTIEEQHRFDVGGIVAHNCAAEAFQMSGHDSYIPPALVVKARKANIAESGPLVIGVDPAWMGKDRFSIALRQGRKVTKVESRQRLDTMAGAGWVKQVIDEKKPVRVFIDVGGPGPGVYDRLVEMGYGEIVRAVNFGSSPLEPQPVDETGKPKGGPRYRRDEMWMKSKEWLEDVGGADIPDLDSLQADACGPTYKYDSLSRVQLESKKDMRKRGVASPDEWDAVALTFAEPVPVEEKRPEPRHYGGEGSWMG